MTTEEQEVDTILQKPRKFKVPTIGLLRLLRIKSLSWKIHPLKLGTVLVISKELGNLSLQPGKNYDGMFLELEGDINKMCRCIAVAVLNNRVGIKLLTRLLAGYFKWRMNPKELLVLTMIIVEQLNLMDFLSAIALIGNLNVIRKASPQSQKEIIAPGTLLEASLNTSDSPGNLHSGE